MQTLISILTQAKYQNLLSICDELCNVPGDMAELGIYKGGTSLALSLRAPHKTIHLFDTFTGMPEAGAVDIHQVGEFADSNFSLIQYAFTGRNAEIHKGFFPDTAKGLEEKRFSLVHLDADQYMTTLKGLEWFWPRMVSGGVIVLDDFDWQNCPGVRMALEVFLASLEERPSVQQHAQYQAQIKKP